MKRIELVEKLETVAPALANNDIIPVMTHFWFTGKKVMAYNGHVAISVPCPTDFKGAVPGSTLLNLLKAASAKDVGLELSEKQLLVKAASSRFKLSTLAPDEFADVFKMPVEPAEPLRLDGGAFRRAVDTCMRSVSMDSSVPDQLGVTMIPSEKRLTFFATSGLTMSRADVSCKGDNPFKKRAILPALFCKQLLQLSDGKQMRLDVDKEHAIFAGKGGALLFGALIESEHPLPFKKEFEQQHPVENDDKLVPVASKLERILERACIVRGDEQGGQTTIEVEKGVAKFFTRSRLGEVRDQMQLTDGHPNVRINVDPKWVKAGCGDFDRMLITRECFVMANDTAYYLISGKSD